MHADKWIFFALILLCCRAQGQYIQVTNNQQDEYHPCWHASGDYIFATTLVSENIELWRYATIDGSGQQISPTNLHGDFYASCIPGTDSIVFDAYDPVSGMPHLWIADISGQACRKLFQFPAAVPSVSPDGNRIAYISGGHIFVKPLYGGTAQQLTFGDPNQTHPAWSPDGSQLAYTTEQGTDYNLWKIPSAGGSPVQLTNYPGYDDHPCWISDNEILFDTDRGGNWDIYKINVHTLETVEFINETQRVCFPAYLSNQNRLCYVSNFSGESELWAGDFINKTGNIDLQNPLEIHPNPGQRFNIELRLEKPEHVTITVMNLFQQTLYNQDFGDLQAGQHMLVLNPSDFSMHPLHLFLCLIKIGKTTSTTRLIHVL